MWAMWYGELRGAGQGLLGGAQTGGQPAGLWHFLNRTEAATLPNFSNEHITRKELEELSSCA